MAKLSNQIVVSISPTTANCARRAIIADREQGIGKAGNRRVRTVMVELAWLWTRYQLGAAQVCWFRERVASTGRRVRKIMVVALARKLLIALWRFVIDGVLPEGAVLKPAA
jgi:transposase